MFKFLKALFTKKPALSIPVVSTTHVTNVLSREKYNELQTLIGRTDVQRDDTECTVSYKLGIQHALKTLEKLCVVNG